MKRHHTPGVERQKPSHVHSYLTPLLDYRRRQETECAPIDITYVQQLGGRERVERVHRIFYGKLLNHPWLKGFFEGKNRDLLESQQTNFMISSFDGPRCYSGRFPRGAHCHMYVTEEIFEIRHGILRESMIEAGVPDALHKRWLDFDLSFKPVIVKRSIGDCEGRYGTDPIISIPRPA